MAMAAAQHTSVHPYIVSGSQVVDPHAGNGVEVGNRCHQALWVLAGVNGLPEGPGREFSARALDGIVGHQPKVSGSERLEVGEICETRRPRAWAVSGQGDRADPQGEARHVVVTDHGFHAEIADNPDRIGRWGRRDANGGQRQAVVINLQAVGAAHEDAKASVLHRQVIRTALNGVADYADSAHVVGSPLLGRLLRGRSPVADPYGDSHEDARESVVRYPQVADRLAADDDAAAGQWDVLAQDVQHPAEARQSGARRRVREDGVGRRLQVTERVGLGGECLRGVRIEVGLPGWLKAFGGHERQGLIAQAYREATRGQRRDQNGLALLFSLLPWGGWR